MLPNEMRNQIIITKDLIKKSNILIEYLFKGIKDKADKPYIGHLKRVSDKLDSQEQKVIGYLHDTIENTAIKREELLELGFPLNIIEAVEIVSKKEEEDYDSFIGRIIKSNNVSAMMVKRSDLEDNMDISRISNPTEKDYQRLEKYKKAYKRLNEALEKEGE